MTPPSENTGSGGLSRRALLLSAAASLHLPRGAAARVHGATTRFTPETFSVATFEAAAGRGGVIAFAAGRYVFKLRPPIAPARPLRLIGAGKGRTVLTTGVDFGGDHRHENGAGGALLLARERVEIEGLSCVGWKYVIGLSAGDRFAGDDSAALYRPGDAAGTPPRFTAGIALKDVAFHRCRRAVYGHGRLHLADFAAWGCDVVDCWSGFWLALTSIDGCHIYDCYFENIFSPGNRPVNGKPWRSGAGLAICLNIDQANRIGTRNVVIES